MEPKAVLRGGWLDGRMIGHDDKEMLIALGPGIIPPEGAVFLASDGKTLHGKVELVQYLKTDLEEEGMIVYEYAGVV